VAVRCIERLGLDRASPWRNTRIYDVRNRMNQSNHSACLSSIHLTMRLPPERPATSPLTT
jgi:hypothetical protein